MYFLIYFTIFLYKFHWSYGDNMTESVQDDPVSDITDALLSLLGSDGSKDNQRINALKDKLSRVNSYVINKHQYSQLLQNESRQDQLNETNFYKALNDEDHFRIRNESKNLYLKMKEKMTRDDLLNILSKRGKAKIMKSARRMLSSDFRGEKSRDKVLDETLDKYLAETAYDEHTFGEKDKYSQYWDPQVELEERRNHLEPDGRRLYKGERTTVRYYPFIVSIHIMSRFWCGGVLYWKDLVLTSASCLQLMHNNRFFRENPKALFVRVGSNHSRIGGELVDALEVYFHPAYNPRTLLNNLAVIRLHRRVRFTYHRVPKCIEISKESQGMPFTAEVLLLGWGVTKTNQKLAFEPIFLQKKVLPVYPNKFCQEVYGDKFITKTMFCAGTLTTGEGACDHDAGGPAIMNGKLVGIISFGPSICGFPDTPTVFTLIGAYVDWIETVNETMPGYYRGNKRTTTTTKDPFAEYFHTATPPPASPLTTPVNTDLFTTRAGATESSSNEEKDPEKPENFRAQTHKQRHKKERIKEETIPTFVITPRGTSSYMGEDIFSIRKQA